MHLRGCLLKPVGREDEVGEGYRMRKEDIERGQEGNN